MGQLCGKALMGQTWHVHHCALEADALHAGRHSCPCGQEWSDDEHPTLSPYLKLFAEAG